MAKMITQGPVRHSELPSYSQAVDQTVIEMTTPTNSIDNGNFLWSLQ